MHTITVSDSRRQTGATLVEFLVAMAIVGLVAGAITTTFANHRRMYAVQEQVASMTLRTQTALELLTREIRAAGTNPTGAVFTPVTYSATQIDLRSDRNGNGTTTDADEHVMYAYDAENRRITRDAGAGVEAVADNIQDFTFTYLNSAGQTTTVSSAIRQLRVTVTARTAAPDATYGANGGYRTYSLTSVITLRN